MERVSGWAWRDQAKRDDEVMTCRCRDLTELWDAEAKRYADEHLRQQQVREAGWEVVYVCPITQARWVEEYPRGAEHGGGPMRLRRAVA